MYRDICTANDVKVAHVEPSRQGCHELLLHIEYGLLQGCGDLGSVADSCCANVHDLQAVHGNLDASVPHVQL